MEQSGGYGQEGRQLHFNKHKLLLAGLLVVLLVIVFSLTLVIIANVAAISTARTSHKDVLSYADSVVTASQVSDEPQVILSAVQSVERPAFKAVPMGDMNNEYRDAKSFYTTTMGKIDEFTKTIGAYAETAAFNGSYQKLKDQMRALDSANGGAGNMKDAEYLNAYYPLVQEVNTLIKKTTVASDYSNEFVELGRVYSSMGLNVEAMQMALRLHSDTAFSNASQQYSMAAAQIPRVEASLGGYAKSIPDKVKAARITFKQYREGLV